MRLAFTTDSGSIICWVEVEGVALDIINTLRRHYPVSALNPPRQQRIHDIDQGLQQAAAPNQINQLNQFNQLLNSRQYNSPWR